MKNKFNYIVYYGDGHLSKYVALNWADACAFIKHCLDNGTKVSGVRKESK